MWRPRSAGSPVSMASLRVGPEWRRWLLSRVNEIDADRFGDAVEGHGLDQVDLGAGQRRDLGAVIVLGFLCGDGVVERVRVAAWPHDPHVHERWDVGPVRFADLAEEADRSELHVLERFGRVADEGGPVRAGPVVDPAHADRPHVAAPVQGHQLVRAGHGRRVEQFRGNHGGSTGKSEGRLPSLAARQCPDRPRGHGLGCTGVRRHADR